MDRAISLHEAWKNASFSRRGCTGTRFYVVYILTHRFYCTANAGWRPICCVVMHSLIPPSLTSISHRLSYGGCGFSVTLKRYRAFQVDVPLAQSSRRARFAIVHVMAEEEHLKDVLVSLRSLIKKQVSLKFAFARGLIYGLGTVIGATVLIALITWLLGIFIQDVSGTPLIGPALEEAQQ